MDMYSKMDGSTPVSPALGGVWEIQRKSRIVDQHKEDSKKGKKKKEEEDEKEFEDGRITEEREMMEDSVTEVDEDKEDKGSENDNPSAAKKIDIII